MAWTSGNGITGRKRMGGQDVVWCPNPGLLPKIPELVGMKSRNKGDRKRDIHAFILFHPFVGFVAKARSQAQGEKERRIKGGTARISRSVRLPMYFFFGGYRVLFFFCLPASFASLPSPVSRNTAVKSVLSFLPCMLGSFRCVDEQATHLDGSHRVEESRLFALTDHEYQDQIWDVHVFPLTMESFADAHMDFVGNVVLVLRNHGFFRIDSNKSDFGTDIDRSTVGTRLRIEEPGDS